MLIHKKSNRRRTCGLNTKKVWYLGPCFKHYRTVRSMVLSTGGERIRDTFRFRHHTIATRQLTAVESILETTTQLDAPIKQQPKAAPMDGITAIKLLREVLLGEKTKPLPPNSVQ